MAYKELEGTNFWKPETEGDQIEGKVIRVEEGIYGDQPILETKDGELGLPSLTALSSKMKKVKLESKVRVTYLGEKKGEKSGRNYKDFKVEVDE